MPNVSGIESASGEDSPGVEPASGEDSFGIKPASGEHSSGIDLASGEDLSGIELPSGEDESGDDESRVEFGSEACMFWLFLTYLIWLYFEFMAVSFSWNGLFSNQNKEKAPRKFLKISQFRSVSSF